MTTELICGPILGFHGITRPQGQPPSWHVGVLSVTQGATPPEVTVDHPVKLTGFKRLKAHRGRHLWRHDIVVPQTSVAQRINYELGGHKSFTVPPMDAAPCMAYASCNGFSQLKLMKRTTDKGANWRSMRSQHLKQPYHLLLMGGDQVYADALWDMLDKLGVGVDAPDDAKKEIPFPDHVKAEVEAFYFDLYCKQWSDPTLASVLASIPTLMMWDDHDIFDGWGSYTGGLQGTDLFKGIFKLAKEHFELFQRQGLPAENNVAPGHGYSVAHRIGPVGLLALDLRSERTPTQILSDDHWASVYEWLDHADGLSHLLVMSSIPVQHPSFQLLEQGLGVFPGHQELEDDLRDHWTSRPHTHERLRLIHRLLDYAEHKKTRVTIISGDVHVAATGVIESRRHAAEHGLNVINQLTASGVVHPPPPGIVLFALNRLFDEQVEIDRDLVGRMTAFPGTPHRFIGKRNWLSLVTDVQPGKGCVRIWANWHVEGEDLPYTKVIHAAPQ